VPAPDAEWDARLVQFRRCDAARPPASELLAAVLVEYDAMAGRALTGGLLTTPADFSSPGGAYLVGFAEGVPACGGGIRALEAGVVEIKRMYVVPRFRGGGLGRALLGALEDAARELGHRAVRLDSTLATWPLYLAAGYREIGDYNGNPHAERWGEKPL
jgi:GNAT superfamily N-acetyltransferase